MLKDVLTILFYALLYSTTIYVVLRFTYKLGRYRAEEAMADEVARLRQSRWKDKNELECELRKILNK